MPSIIIQIAWIGLFIAANVSSSFAQSELDASRRFQPKAVPEITWRNLSPPFNDYLYYAYAEEIPFEPASKSFSPANAWWLSEAATLVYSDENFARDHVPLIYTVYLWNHLVEKNKE